MQALVFIAEPGVNLGSMRLFAWALKGDRAQGAQPKRGKHVALVAGLRLTGVVASASVLGAFDGLTFEAFVATRRAPNLWAGACVVMANCSIHPEAVMRPLLEGIGARLVSLPPYSPAFAP
ncbi:MAG: transposase [Verrucomicrobia bacterium]|nr:transposase [Leptolyngbya sp. ES-bin-22]